MFVADNYSNVVGSFKIHFLVVASGFKWTMMKTDECYHEISIEFHAHGTKQYCNISAFQWKILFPTNYLRRMEISNRSKREKTHHFRSESFELNVKTQPSDSNEESIFASAFTMYELHLNVPTAIYIT